MSFHFTQCSTLFQLYIVSLSQCGVVRGMFGIYFTKIDNQKLEQISDT